MIITGTKIVKARDNLPRTKKRALTMEGSQYKFHFKVFNRLSGGGILGELP
jgi:hypothetical protein